MTHDLTPDQWTALLAAAPRSVRDYDNDYREPPKVRIVPVTLPRVSILEKPWESEAEWLRRTALDKRRQSR